MKYYLGIDSGGTKTICLAADEQGRILSVGLGGSGASLGNDAFADNSIIPAIDQAIAKLHRIIKELQQEKEGLISPKSIRDAEKKQISEHLQDFILNKSAIGRAKKHVQDIASRITAVCNYCEWNYLIDIKADEFEHWRSVNKHSKSDKTLNEYLSSWNSFCSWLLKRNRIKINVFETVDRIDLRRKEEDRRALTVEEVQRLISIAGTSKLKAGYMLAVYCGLRRNEINTLKWSDLHLDEKTPFLIVRSVNTKNSKIANIPIIEPLRDFLTAYSIECNNNEFVTGRLPRMRDMLTNWEKAGIPYKDSLGRIANFHCLRRILCQSSASSST